MVKILQIVLAFSEYMNFITHVIYHKIFLTHIEQNFSINNEGENLLVTGTEIIVVSWISNKYVVQNGEQIIYGVAFVSF